MITKTTKTPLFNSLLNSEDIETINLVRFIEMNSKTKNKLPRWNGCKVDKSENVITVHLYNDKVKMQLNEVAQFRFIP